MIAFSAGGRWLATCNALKPPHEIPIMPTAPLHQGWAASQAITSQCVSLLLRQIFIQEQTVRIAGAAHVDANGGVAVPGEIGVHLAVAQHGSVPPPIRQIFEDRRHWRVEGIVGQPDRRRKAGAVGKGDPFRRNRPHLAGEVFADRDVHGRSFAWSQRNAHSRESRQMQVILDMGPSSHLPLPAILEDVHPRKEAAQKIFCPFHSRLSCCVSCEPIAVYLI